MRRITTWLLGTVTVLVLLFGYHTSTSGALAGGSDIVASSPAQPGAVAGGDGSGTAGGSSASGGPGEAGAPSTVNGPVVQTEWGPVQVQVTVHGTTITDVAVPVYPNGNSRDQEINAYALPILVQATLNAQSADVDMVSGATITSGGYLQSLQAALDEARP